MSIFLVFTHFFLLITGGMQLIVSFLGVHMLLLFIFSFFKGGTNTESNSAIFGYLILFLLVVGLIGFSVCIGSINIH